ncbi:hypothetical protein MF271_21290 (plasmid) [Deinococcus sp. KNUC1210]|uniref:cellulose synthase operon protein YhjQ/BcsQ n=1 Tax=Deinococcus sp. KNUC1210 TaxID=2917691 RepID=UPI001EF0007F|nr:cellulose synthase operon protein YhjQ/BcsQ [Deinococcus sp. KNUC1210]ULH17806.1 hypothetical protein MF271_21290 [Deinococcus sp. KNUC1210]
MLRRRALPLLLAAGVAGGAAFVLASRQTPVYDAVSSLVTVRSDGGSDRVNGSVYAAPSLPHGTLPEALQSRSVLQHLLDELRASPLPPSTVQPLRQAVQTQLQGGPSSVSVVALGDGQQEGVFEVHGRASTPQGAQLLAQAGADALLLWDADRAQSRLTQLRQNMQRQLAALETQLGTATPASTASRTKQVEWQTLETARTQVLQNLAQVTALSQSTTGTLERVAAATLPTQATAPRPLRSGVLAAVLALLLGSGAALLFDRARRPIYSQADLRGLPVPLLGHLPALRGIGSGQQLLNAVRSGAWLAPLGFVRVNLQARLGAAQNSRRIVLTGTQQGEGTSSVTAALAASFASTGARVLLVEAAGAPRGLLPVPEERRLQSASAPVRPELQLLSLDQQTDLLPSSAVQQGGSLDLTNLDRMLTLLDSTYDVILIDAPPLLTSPEAVALAARASGLVLLVVPGETGQREVEAALDAARMADAQVLGLIFNDRPAHTVAPATTPVASAALAPAR